LLDSEDEEVMPEFIDVPEEFSFPSMSGSLERRLRAGREKSAKKHTGEPNRLISKSERASQKLVANTSWRVNDGKSGRKTRASLLVPTKVGKSGPGTRDAHLVAS
jgi:hypothetical protein